MRCALTSWKIQHNIPEQMFPAMPIFVSPTVQGVKFLYKAHVVVVVLPAEHKICKMWGFAQNPMHTIYFILLYFRPFNGHGCCSWMCGTILALQQKGTIKSNTYIFKQEQPFIGQDLVFPTMSKSLSSKIIGE